MAPTTIDVSGVQVAAPPPLPGLLRVTTAGGTEVNLQAKEDSSPTPVFIRGASGHLEPQAELDPGPAKLDIPWPSLLMEKQTRVAASCLAPGNGEEFACHKSQCSTEDPNEEACQPLSPRSETVTGPPADIGGLSDPQLEIPTKGSAGHFLGKCKPCAFVFKDGCESGVNCEFCHICQPGEKKRRKKERRSVRLGRSGGAQQIQQQLPQYEVVCQAQLLPQPPPPDLPPPSPWLYDSSENIYQSDALPDLFESEFALGSKAWQLEKSQARSHPPYSYSQQNQAWYAGYQGW